MYRVEYFCPRQSPYWQVLKSGILFKTPQIFETFPAAQNACNQLLFQFHSARVIDPWGAVVYQI